MNERIRELAEQADLSKYNDLDDTYVAHINELKKFAELMVRETMQVVANNLPQNTYLDVADAVIEHFKE